MRYNWPRSALAKPDRDRRKLAALALEAGLSIEEVGRLEDQGAVLFRVDP